MNELAQQLADDMGVTVADVMALAKSVANSLLADGVNAEQVEQHGTELVEAYVPHAVKKLDQFVTTYHANPEARKVFQLQVFNDLKESAPCCKLSKSTRGWTHDGNCANWVLKY